jgi:hypothetical protein
MDAEAGGDSIYSPEIFDNIKIEGKREIFQIMIIPIKYYFILNTLGRPVKSVLNDLNVSL